MIRCLIVDDENISRKFLEHFVGQTTPLILIKSCNNSEEAAKVLSEEKVDLVFLDIEMPGKSGLELLEQLEVTPLIILVSSQEKYALKSFEYEVVDYLLKPITFQRFEKAVFKAQKQLSFKVNSPLDKTILLKATNKIVKLIFRDIIYIEAKGDYLQVHTADKKILVHGTMSEMLSKLPPAEFSRIHRSYIVRDGAIEKFDKFLVYIGGAELPLGESYKKAFFLKINI